MKRILSMLLAVCMVLGLMAGMAVTAFAEDDVETIAITGVTAPTAGGAVTTEGITGAPEGFTLSAQWQVYDYAEEDFDPTEDAVFADNSVYRLEIELEAEEGYSFSYDTAYELTVNGEAVDDQSPLNEDESGNGYLKLCIYKLYFVGDITFIDQVTIEALPAEEVGASTELEGIVLPDGAPYRLSINTQWYRYDDQPVGSTLEADLQYALWTYIVPEEGYWISPDAEMSAPREPDYFHVDTDGSMNADFYYDTRPLVKEVDITLNMDLAYGDPTADLAVTVPEDAKYTVSTAWEPDAETLGYGEYRLCLNVTPAEGYFIADDLTVTVNGQSEDEAENWYISHWDETEAEIEMWFEIAPENGFAQNIKLSGAPGSITAGEAITAPTVNVERGDVTVSKTEWVDADHAPVSGKFEDGKEYYLAISLTPAEGYALRDGYYVQVQTEDGYENPYMDAEPDGTAVVYVRYSLQPTVDAIEITVTEPVVGAAPAEPKVPEGAKYSIERYQWYDYSTYSDVTVFEDDKGYYLELYVIPAEGYEFGEDAKLTVNGKEPNGWGVSDQEVSISVKYSFLTQIDRVDITVPEPTLGGTGSVESIQLPADAKYSLDMDTTRWYGHATEFTGTFEKDAYELSLRLIADEGCEFNEDTELYINGVLCENFYTYGSYTWAEGSYRVSFRDVITKVEIPALPTIAVGDEATDPELEAPEGANYTLPYAWWALSAGSLSLDEFTGSFENGAAYYLMLQVMPNPGYEFSEDTVITIGGKEFAGVQIINDDWITVAKQYALGLEVIDKVEVTVDAPENGKVPGKVTVPENAGYEVDEFAWAAGKDADMDEAETMGKKETCAYGNYYWVSGSIVAKEGYVMAEDAVITVNGQAVDLSVLKDVFGFIPVMGDTAIFYHSLGQLTEPAQEPEPTPPADIPDTGDMSALAYTVIGLSSLLSMGALTVQRKRR